MTYSLNSHKHLCRSLPGKIGTPGISSPTNTSRCTAEYGRAGGTLRTFIRAENRLRCRASGHYESSKGIKVAVKRRPDFTLDWPLFAIACKKYVSTYCLANMTIRALRFSFRRWNSILISGNYSIYCLHIDD